MTHLAQAKLDVHAVELRPGPLFVLSIWRSGSSLLYALLNQHPEIGLLYEGNLPRLHSFLSGRFHDGSWRERWEFWNKGPSRHDIPIESMPDRVCNAWEATRIVYQEFARRKHAAIWGEKTPHWFDCPLELASRFPDASFIFLWRDPNAVLKSISRAAHTERFFNKSGFTEKILIGNENLRNACDALRKQNHPVHEIHYEDLVANPSECMRQICDFLQIPFDERMTTLAGADTSAISSGSHHLMVRGNRIRGHRIRAEVLTLATQAKINRYIRRWKQMSNGEWPKYPDALPAGTRAPSPIELWRDRTVYKIVLGRDRLVSMTYAMVPMNIARGLRAFIRQRGRRAELLQFKS